MSRALERVLEKIQAFSADFDERVKANVLRTGAEVVAQLLHSDIRPGSLRRGRPQRSVMVVLENNTHLMLADGTAVVAHR